MSRRLATLPGGRIVLDLYEDDDVDGSPIVRIYAPESAAPDMVWVPAATLLEAADQLQAISGKQDRGAQALALLGELRSFPGDPPTDWYERVSQLGGLCS
jgi:hypothetical protein